MTIGLNKETLLSAVAVVLVVAGGWYAYSHRSAGVAGVANAGQPVATVDGVAITRGELNQAEMQLAAGQGLSATSTDAKAQFESQALDSLISRQLLIAAAQKAGVTASSTAVNTQLEAAVAQAGGQDNFNKLLASQGLTQAQAQKQLSEDLMIQQYLAQTLNLSSTTVTEADIQAAYDKAAAGQKNVPKLSQVHDQVKQMVLAQKQQEAVMSLVAQLKASADIKTLI